MRGSRAHRSTLACRTVPAASGGGDQFGGVVEQVGQPRRGQPATPLFLNPGGAYVIGVEIGWRHFEVLLLAMSGKTLASIRRSYEYPDIDTIFTEVCAEIATVRSGMSDFQAGRLIGMRQDLTGVPHQYAIRDRREDRIQLGQLAVLFRHQQVGLVPVFDGPGSRGDRCGRHAGARVE